VRPCRPRVDTVAFDNITENDSVLAYLPLAWVGDHYLNYAQGYVSGFCMNCPESQETVPTICARSGPASISRRRASSRGC
jgi:long-chain acyl-CoA synthetase